MAIVLGRAGIDVLLLERQPTYRDRVRGEYMAPWGVLETRALGLEDVLRSTHPVDGRYSATFDELIDPSMAAGARRDNSRFLPDVAGPLCASHPKSCAALSEEAVRLGVKLVRGVADVRLQTGPRPTIRFRNGQQATVRPRLVIGADGRASTVRTQSGITLNTCPPTHQVTGLLADGASSWPEDFYTIGVEGDLMFYVFPQGTGRVRLYTCHANAQAKRWAGPGGAQRMLDTFAQLRAIPDEMRLDTLTPAGPCATFSAEQTWCATPYADGTVLIGDAGGYDNPVDGQGLSLAMSDVRHLSELLVNSDDWTADALRPYGEQRAERLRRMRRVSTTFAGLMTCFSAAGRARRARFYEASRAGRQDVQAALAAIWIGPERLPADAFTDELHDALLAVVA